VSNSSLFTSALLKTYSFVLFAIHDTRRIFLRPFRPKASRRVSSFFLSVQLSQPYIATGTPLNAVIGSQRKIRCAIEFHGQEQLQTKVSNDVFICPIAIAYSMGQIIKSFCVCECVCVCPYGRISSSIFTKLDTDV